MTRIKCHPEWLQESRGLLRMVLPDGDLCGYIPLIRHDPKQAVSTVAVAVLIFVAFLFGCLVMGVM